MVSEVLEEMSHCVLFILLSHFMDRGDIKVFLVPEYIATSCSKSYLYILFLFLSAKHIHATQQNVYYISHLLDTVTTW